MKTYGTEEFNREIRRRKFNGNKVVKFIKLIYHCIAHLTWPIPKTDPSDGDKFIKCKCGKVLYYKVIYD